LPRCHNCDNLFPQDAAKFCLQCGEARFERCHISDAFCKMVGSRTYLRSMDLNKFIRHTSDMLNSLGSVSKETSKSYRCISHSVQNAFNAVVGEQQKNGITTAPGITMQYFEDFLLRVSHSLDLSLPSLLSGILDQASRWSLAESANAMASGANPLSSPSARQNAHTIEVLETPSERRRGSKSLFSRECTKCGSKFISQGKFCCECGEKQPDPVKPDKTTFHIFKGTSQRLAAGLQPEVSIEQRDFEELVSLSKKHHMPLEDIRKRQVEFRDFDKSKNGTLSLDEFVYAVRRHCNIPEDEEVPKHLVDQAWFNADGDGTGCVSFEEYVVWSSRVSCTEEMLVLDPQERHIRHLARSYGLPLTDVDNLKKVFDQFSQGDKGISQIGELRSLLAVGMDVPGAGDVPDQTVNRMWMELDPQRSGCISFERFLIWSCENLSA